MKRSLTLRWPRTKTVEAKLVWEEGHVQIADASDDLRPLLLELIESGLHDWIGDRENASPRTTLATDPDFLPRLGQHLKRQGGFDPRIEDERAPARLRVARRRRRRLSH